VNSVRRWLARGSLACLAAGATALVVMVVWVMSPVDPALLSQTAMRSVTIEDRSGTVLRSTRAADGSRAEWTPFAAMDADLVNAFVAVEDRRFWTHGGIDWRAVGRAMRDNVRAGRIVSGASTITMQLARLLQEQDRGWEGKLGQALWALRLERHLTKQQILEQYLNRIELGQATVGVGAASALYFGTSPSEVSLGQAATIAGLAHAPSRDNPYAAPARARRRRDRVLGAMQRLGYAQAADIDRAHHEPLVAAPRTPPFLAPHFTTRVLGWLADSGVVPNGAPVRTSIDHSLQAELEAEVRHTVDVLHDRGVEQAAAVVLDNETGEVLAWVGSPDFWAPDDGQTDMVVSARQPGSALKPFLYALAFDGGSATPATVLPDIPKAYATATGAYNPRNYDRRFRGPVRAREALASSYNVPAVELASRVGTGALLHTLQLAGFESLRRGADYYGLGLALGNGDVTLIELANGYRALANDGEWRPWTWQPRDPRAPAPELGIDELAEQPVLGPGDAQRRVAGRGEQAPDPRDQLRRPVQHLAHEHLVGQLAHPREQAERPPARPRRGVTLGDLRDGAVQPADGFGSERALGRLVRRAVASRSVNTSPWRSCAARSVPSGSRCSVTVCVSAPVLGPGGRRGSGRGMRRSRYPAAARASRTTSSAQPHASVTPAPPWP